MVFVLDTKRRLVAPCSEKRARLLLERGKAAVFRRFPFTIILKYEIAEPVNPSLRLKIDPGSRISGLAVVNDQSGAVLFAAEVQHRGLMIKQALDDRRGLRRGRRARKTRYRSRRFDNRTRPKGWLPPSLESRVANIVTWAERIRRVCPIAALSQELVKFDTQQMEKPEINGTEYQQGELVGYEIREYLLEKFNRTCSYCRKKDMPIEIEHIVPRSRGGSNRVSNLTLACRPCNQDKGNRTAAEYGHPEVGAEAKRPLKDAAAVNATRWKLLDQLKGFGLPVETGTGGRTKYNRTRQGISKSHWADAACVGASTPILSIRGVRPLIIKAAGHGRRQRCQTDKYGFPKAHARREKRYQGFQTGDIVRARVPNGKYRGVHEGRITIRFRPSFRLNGFDVHPKYLTRLHRADGYGYEMQL